jgi:arsenite methyltransferase
MPSDKELKELVKEKYGAIADQAKKQGPQGCCGSSCGCSDTVEFSVMAEDYTKLSGYVPEADLALGCGLPTEYAMIRPGDTVVDLGSGAGNDCFVARSIVGPGGKVLGIDMTDAMIATARANAAKLGYVNVEFRLGDIEAIPIEENLADVVVSNCVMNLVPDKKKAFAETFRIIKPGGHFSISDIVLQGELPEAVRQEAALYAGCIGGALQKADYLAAIASAGFVDITIQKERRIEVPPDILERHLSDEQAEDWRTRNVGIFSVTVFARKPSARS